MMVSVSGEWGGEPHQNHRFLLALAAGLILEIVALALLLPTFQPKPPPARQPSVVKITIQAPPPPVPKPPPPTTKPPPPRPVTPPPPPKPASPPPPKPVPAPSLPKPPPVPMPPKPEHHAKRPRVVAPHPQPPPKPQHVAPPTPPAPALPPAPSLGQVDAFRLAMRNAVQAVAEQVYPQAAQMAHEMGVPEVTFTYRNGAVTDIALARSSGFPLLDRAAMRAARIAHYPLPPSGFGGRIYQVTVAVEFEMTAASNLDGD